MSGDLKPWASAQGEGSFKRNFGFAKENAYGIEYLEDLRGVNLKHHQKITIKEVYWNVWLNSYLKN